jgi:hypothetical protein
MLPWLSIYVLAPSHLLYLVPFIRAMRQSRLPQPVDFIGLSAVAYFDFGLLCEAFGYRYRSQFFEPFFEAQPWEVIVGVLLVAAAPWLIRAGSRILRAPDTVPLVKRQLSAGPRKLVFYVIVVVVCGAAIAVPLSLASLGTEVWQSRMLIGEILGPWILVLSVPMYLIGFYVRLSDAESLWGKLVLVGLLVSSVLATIAVGERTAIILPFLIVLLFGQRFSWRRWVAVGIATIVGAALMLPLFKPAYQVGGDSPAELFTDTVANDFYRAPELATVLGMSSAFGTRVLERPGAGYIYAALFFVPRAAAPFKGDSTALTFTGAVMHRSPKSLDWGFGISAISEALLNVGIVLTPVVLVFYGVVIGWLARKSGQWMSLQVPLSLACLWLFGYHLPSILQNFGAMALVGAGCERCFTTEVGMSRASTSHDMSLETSKAEFL